MLAFGFRSILCRMNLLWLFDQAFSRNTELIMQTPDHYHANAGSLASSRNGTNARPDVFADPFDSCGSYPPVTLLLVVKTIGKGGGRMGRQPGCGFTCA